MRRRWTGWAVLGMALVAACSSGSSAGAVTVSLSEFGLEADPASASAGSVAFEIRNTGDIEHDFYVLATDLGHEDLPTSGGLADVDADGIEVVNSVKGIVAGTDERLTVPLEAGAYVLICNVDGHYQSGMSAAFDVS